MCRLQVQSVHDGIYALGKAHTRSTGLSEVSLRSVPNVNELSRKMTTEYVHRFVGFFLLVGLNRSRSAHDSDSGAVPPTASEPNPRDTGNVKTPVIRSTLCAFCFLPSQSRLQISHPCSLISFPLCSKSPRSTYTGVDGSPVGTRGRAGLAGFCQPSAFARMQDWVLCHSRDISELSATGRLYSALACWNMTELYIDCYH